MKEQNACSEANVLKRGKGRRRRRDQNAGSQQAVLKKESKKQKEDIKVKAKTKIIEKHGLITGSQKQAEHRKFFRRQHMDESAMHELGASSLRVADVGLGDDVGYRQLNQSHQACAGKRASKENQNRTETQ